MRSLPRTILGLVCSAAVLAHAWAQNTNLISNGGFESVRNQANLWYGTGPDGSIEVMRGQVPVLTERGNIANTAMPASVALGDLNNDGKLDLLVGGVTGYVHVFFNQGTREEPKFTRGELLPIFLTRLRSQNENFGETWFRYMAPRYFLGDMARTGRLDLWIGNYSGEVLRVPNQGSAAVPDFRQPPDVARLIIPTTTDVTRRWGNVFAPALWDVDGDGLTDLLLGEGSYSANSIHVLLNKGSNAAPRFDENNRHVLAYGMGREQLTPAVVDYNGDGQPDLLVADRTGRIGLYSATITPTDAEAKADNIIVAQAGGRAAQAGKWKPGEHLPFVSYLTTKTGKEIRFSGIPTIAVGDLTGNGAFDIVVGNAQGRVQWIRNSGTPTEPKFEEPQPLKGEPTPAFQIPSGWVINTGNGEGNNNVYRGNFLAYATVVDKANEPNLNPPEGERALKIGYLPSINQVMRNANFSTPLPAIGQPADRNVVNADWRAPSNAFEISRDIQLEVNREYTLTFSIRGTGVQRASGSMDGTRRLVIQQGRQEQVGRGGVRTVGEQAIQETVNNPIRVSVGSNWTTITTNISTKFQDRQLNGPDERGRPARVNFRLVLAFELAPNPQSAVYLDNFSLTAK